MKVIQLQARNIKNLKAIDITPGDGAVVLRGSNGAGKSATLEAMMMALTGKKIPEPVRRGKKKAEVNVDMGDYRVRLCLSTTGAPRLEVWDADRKKVSSPRAFLDKIIGQLAFDPLPWTMSKPADQRQTLMELTGLDFTKANAQRQAAYNERTIINRQIRDAEGSLSCVDAPDKDTPKEEVSVAGAVELVSKLREKRAAYVSWKNEMAGRKDDVVFWGEKMQAIEEKIEDLRAQHADIVAKQSIAIKAEKSTATKEPMNPTDEDIAKGEAGIALAEQTNIAVRNAKLYREYEGKIRELQDKSQRLTDEIEEIDRTKATKIAEAEYPIEGLSVDDEQVLYNDVPVSQLSSGEQIRVATAVAMALNPTLRVICVREGSLLDDEGKQAMQDLAAERDYQLWMEVVGTEGAGIVIEDGLILGEHMEGGDKDVDGNATEGTS